MVLVYSFAHFIVDFACAFMIFRFIPTAPDASIYMLLYNFCAFAMQAPLGVVADRLSRNNLFAAIGCALVAVTFGLIRFAPFLVLVICAGVGNAMFHIGGGIDVLNISEVKAGALGVFVSPGALGIFFGAMFGRGWSDAYLIYMIAIVLALILMIGMILALRFAQDRIYTKNVPFAFDASASPQPCTAPDRTASPQPFAAPDRTASQQPHAALGGAESPALLIAQDGSASPRLLIVAACVFVVVCLRSYIGLSLDFPWKSTGAWGIKLTVAVALGKFLGGFMSDIFGKKKTACVSLGASAILFLFPGAPASGVAAVLFFNMTMPLTLWAIAAAFPSAKGFSFGLLSFALFLGYLPVFSGVTPPQGASYVWQFYAAAAAVISIPLLYAGLKSAVNFSVRS